MSVLGTVTALASLTEFSGLVRSKSQVHELVFEDWTVDGVPLRELITARRETPTPVQEMTRLCETWPEEAVHGLRRLLGAAPGDFDDGRVALLVCPVCGDLGCRALSTTLVLGNQAVEWRDLGWQADYEPSVAAEGGFDPPICLRFDRGPYEHLLRGLLTRYEALVSCEAPPVEPKRGNLWHR